MADLTAWSSSCADNLHVLSLELSIGAGPTLGRAYRCRTHTGGTLTLSALTFSQDLSSGRVASMLVERIGLGMSMPRVRVRGEAGCTVP
jgi:hypothetical protein